MQTMQHVKCKPQQSLLAMLRLVEYMKVMAVAAAAAATKRKVPPNVSPSTPSPSIVAYSLALKNDNTSCFLKSDVILVSENGDLHDVTFQLGCLQQPEYRSYKQETKTSSPLSPPFKEHRG